MTKEEYIKTLQKWEDDNTQIDDDYGSGYSVALQDAINVVEKLDEPKKVIIPQFVADRIEEAKEHYGSEIDPLKIVYWAGSHIIDTDSHYEWLENIHNQELLFNAIANGYEVENEIEKYVRLKGFEETTNYLNYDVNSKEFFVDTAGLGSGIKIKFTKRWLKDYWSEYDVYNNAGLLEFEEVENE